LYRQGARAGIASDDVARLLAGEHLGARHDAAVESLAGSSAASRGWRVAASLEGEIAGLAGALSEASTVVAFTPRAARVRQFAPWAAAAAIAAVAVSLGNLRSPVEPAGGVLADAGVPAPAAEADVDVISRFSWEEGAMVAALPAAAPSPVSERDAVFVDEFGAGGGS
jgi:hypothetical protein